MEIFNPSQKKIIEILLKRSKTLPEIASALHMSKPGTSNYLKKLEELNIIKGTYERNTDGRTIRYSLQSFHIVFSVDPQTHTTLNFKADDTFDTENIYLGLIPQKEFREEVKHYLHYLTKVDIDSYLILLYGSVAQGKAQRKSDIDLLLLKEQWLQKDKEAILNQIAQATLDTKHQAKPQFITRGGFRSLDKSLKKEIKDYGVIIFEKGTQWNKIKQELKRYKTISI